jgi:glycosyltransferase involved in cell wall biosynthesis
MPRVLRIINRLNLGGPTFNAALLTRHLAPEFETLLVAGIKQDSEESSEFIVRDLGLHFVQLPEMQREIRWSRDRAAYRRLRAIIRDFRPDIVHTHAAKAGALGRLAALHEKVPVILHTFHGHVFHSYFHPLKTRMFLGIERYLARHSSAIIAISERQRDELAYHYKVCEPEKLHVVPLGFDLSRFREGQVEKRKAFRQRYGLGDETLAVGIIGRLAPVKNHPLFLRAIRGVLDQGPAPVRFFVIGDGETRSSLFELCTSLGLPYAYEQNDPEALIQFTGWDREVDRSMAGLDVVCLTSFNEGTPVSLIEAQAAGKPIVSTAVGGIENVVIPGETALLVPSDNQNAFTTALNRLIRNEPARIAMTDKGWEHVRDRFHYTRLVREMGDLYRKLLK